jgi:hypothetical protein
MSRKPKSQQDPTPINKHTLDDKIEKMAGGSNGDIPPESPADMALADQLWSELEDENHEVEVSRIPVNYLTELRRRVRDGEVSTSMLTGDDAVAADNWTRTEIGRLFIRFRRRVGKYRIREFIPVIHDQPTERREWVRGSAYCQISDNVLYWFPATMFRGREPENRTCKRPQDKQSDCKLRQQAMRLQDKTRLQQTMR